MSETPTATLVTGFPGFIAGRLLSRLAALHPEARFDLLVQPHLCAAAEAACAALDASTPGLSARCTVHPGDLREPDLGLSTEAVAALAERVTEVWHLAAIYDLAVPEALAHAVNVGGTERVLDLCAKLPRLEELQYISTCYVAGRRQGLVREDELEHDAGFHNHYESTKYGAEVAVRRRRGEIPTRIYRPGVVVGDSRTGETAKADGPYFAMKLLLQTPRRLPLPMVGRADAPLCVVPVDWLVDAMAQLSVADGGAGRVFQLADPEPPTFADLLQRTAELLGRPRMRGHLPVGLAAALGKAPVVGPWLGIPEQTLDYLHHYIVFDTSNVRELLGDALPCPRPMAYWPAIVEYARTHPEIFARKAA